MQVRIADYNSRKLTALQRPLYTPVYDDESSGESSGNRLVRMDKEGSLPASTGQQLVFA